MRPHETKLRPWTLKDGVTGKVTCSLELNLQINSNAHGNDFETLTTGNIRPDEMTFPANVRTQENDRSLELKNITPEEVKEGKTKM